MQGGLKQTVPFYTTWGQSSHMVVGQPKCWGPLSVSGWFSGGCWLTHLPGLAVCLRHKAFEVNDGKPGLGSYAQTTHISCSSDVGLHEDVCELRLSPICSEAFLKPRPGSRLNSLNGQEPDRNTFPNWRKKLS